MNSEDCYFGTLARLQTSDNPGSSTAAVSSKHVDLLLALSGTHMLILVRKTQKPSQLCICTSPDDLTVSSSAQQRLSSNFQCPHVESVDIYEPRISIAYESIVQVQLTFREVHASVAERTKDCVVVLQDERELRLEFEHNLTRGAFLDALMAISIPHVTLDMDYINLATLHDDHQRRHSSFDFLNAAVKPACPQRNFALHRQALRVALQSRIQVALQLSSEVSLSDPNCHFLLGTSMELSRALDEPDLHTLTWLVSGFINLQRARLSKPHESAKLAQKQLQHAIDLAREHSQRLLLALALVCCADLHVVYTQQRSAAKAMLIEAARLMPPNVLTTAEKMQLHTKIHDLGGPLLHVQQEKTEDQMGTDWLDLRKALSTALSASSTTTNGTTLCQEQCPLLHAVTKSSTGRSRYCFVDVETPSTVLTAMPLQRLRVHFSETDTLERLRDEITQRCTAISPSGVDLPQAMEVGVFYDSAETSNLPIPWATHLSELGFQNGRVLRAVLGPLHPVKLQALSRDTAGAMAGTSDKLARCSQCGEQVRLEDVEQHSESCE